MRKMLDVGSKEVNLARLHKKKKKKNRKAAQ